ncbi:hypothetical protein [Streptomyces sp. NPDC048606]|uniref:hypothetical protein n=1 Tax=Streptomyces sp. NPDC048606 TaxID=3154726 RepID=UPI003424CDBD
MAVPIQHGDTARAAAATRPTAARALFDRQGVGIAGFLTAAHAQGVGVDRAVAVLPVQPAAVPAATGPPAGPASGVPAARPAPAANPYAAPAGPEVASAPAAPDPAPAQVSELVAVSTDTRAMWGR